MATLRQTNPDVAATPRRAQLGAGFRALRLRNYRLYWSGQLVSQVGTWMQSTAQAWLVLQLTASPFAIGLVAAFQFLPIMLLSLVGGALADRVPRYRLILITQVLSLVQALVFAGLVASGTIQLWHVYALALALGLISAVDMPVRQAFAVTLVPAEDRANAVALNSMMFNISRILGPALAGVLIGALGIAAVLFINAVSFVAVIVGLLRMDRASFAAAPARAAGRVTDQVREGLAYIRQTPEVMLVMILIGAIGTFGYNFSVTLPLIGGFILNTSAAQYGLLGTFLGAGSLLGALVTAYAPAASPRRLLLGAAAFSILLGALALTPHYGMAAALLVLLGFVGILFTTASNTLIQLRVPDALRGRVTSVYQLLFAGSTPIGGLLIGALASALNVPAALLACAALCLLGVAVGWRYARHTRDAALVTR